MRILDPIGNIRVELATPYRVLTHLRLYSVASGSTYVEDVDSRGFLINFVDDSVHVWLSAIEKMPDAGVFESQRGAVWVFLKAEDSFLKSVKPPRCLLG